MTRAVDAVVTGAGGFIGGHLVRALRAEGRSVRAIDVKPIDDWCQTPDSEVECVVADLSHPDAASRALRGGAGEVYNLAADMGGMEFIEQHKAACMLSVLISTNVLVAARDAGVDRFFYSSSACVYAADKQVDTDVLGLREGDAYPAMPEDGYGWEKLFSERMARHFREDFGVATRVGRYHNVYGPYGTWVGGREKAPAAACRKVAEAVATGHLDIEIWGDGEQTRSFTFIDDCVHGTLALTRSGFHDPLNIGSAEMVSINQLYALVAELAGIEPNWVHVPGALGVRGRNSDNTLVREVLEWEPSTSLREGMARTYEWVAAQVAARRAGQKYSN